MKDCTEHFRLIKDTTINSLKLMQNIELKGQTNFYIGFNVMASLNSILQIIEEYDKQPNEDSIVADNTKKNGE